MNAFRGGRVRTPATPGASAPAWNAHVRRREAPPAPPARGRPRRPVGHSGPRRCRPRSRHTPRRRPGVAATGLRRARPPRRLRRPRLPRALAGADRRSPARVGGDEGGRRRRAVRRDLRARRRDGPSIESPWWLVVVLAGVAVALWAPRGVPAPAGPVVERHRTSADDRVGADGLAAAAAHAAGSGAVGARSDRARRGRRRGGRRGPDRPTERRTAPSRAVARCGRGRLRGRDGRRRVARQRALADRPRPPVRRRRLRGRSRGEGRRRLAVTRRRGRLDRTRDHAHGELHARSAARPASASSMLPATTQRADLRVGIGGDRDRRRRRGDGRDPHGRPRR